MDKEELIEKCKLKPKERVNSLHKSRGANHTEIDDKLLTDQLQKALPIIESETRKEIGRWISKRKDTGSPWVYITQKEVDKLLQGEMPE